MDCCVLGCTECCCAVVVVRCAALVVDVLTVDAGVLRELLSCEDRLPSAHAIGYISCAGGAAFTGGSLVQHVTAAAPDKPFDAEAWLQHQRRAQLAFCCPCDQGKGAVLRAICGFSWLLGKLAVVGTLTVVPPGAL